MRRITTMTLWMALALAAGGAGAADEHEHPAVPADSRLEFLKRLAGAWASQPGAEGEPGSTIEFRVTAGGHAVEEREMIGTPMEMVTLYYMEGGNLVATHYCVAGNRPRLVAAPRVSDDTLSFACAGVPGGAASHDEEHVHGWKMRLDGEGRLHYTTEIVERGQVTHAPGFVLTRKTETTSR